MQLPPEIRGIIAETALTGLVRYDWQHLLAPLLHHLLDAVLTDYAKEYYHNDEEGPPRPLPNDQSYQNATHTLHSLLSSFSRPPFTMQRLCEILLEPRKHYARLDKLLAALDRILRVTSTVPIKQWISPSHRMYRRLYAQHTNNNGDDGQTIAAAAAAMTTTTATRDNDMLLPPLPLLSSLCPVNENPPSPYDGEPPAGPLPHPDGGAVHGAEVPPDVEERAIFATSGMAHTANAASLGAGCVVTVNTAFEFNGTMNASADDHPMPGTGGKVGPLGEREAMQAEAFASAALARDDDDGIGGYQGWGDHHDDQKGTAMETG